MHELVTTMADAMTDLLGAPFAIFGHSLGATVGFELTRELRRRGGPQARALFVSGARAPWLPRKGRDRHRLPDEDLVEELRHLNGTPRELLEQRELLELLLPTIRADLAVSDHYEYAAQEPLDVPIHAFAGSRDPLASRRAVSAWGAETRSVFTLHTLDGDHFFINAQRARLLALVQACIEKLEP